MIQDLITKTLDYAWNHQIGYVLTDEMKENGISFSFSDKRIIIINMNWYNRKELPFIICHEIAHVLNDDEHSNYHASSATINMKQEKRADIDAVKILVPIYLKMIGEEYNYNNICPLMQQLCIPDGLENEVIHIVMNHLWYK